MRRKYARIHDIDDASGAGVAAVVPAVEISVELVDSIEMPQDIDMRVVAATCEARRRMDRIERDVNFATVGRDELGVGRSQWQGRGYKNSAGEESSHARTLVFRKSLGRLDSL